MSEWGGIWMHEICEVKLFTTRCEVKLSVKYDEPHDGISHGGKFNSCIPCGETGHQWWHVEADPVSGDHKSALT